MRIFDSKCKELISEGLIRSYNSKVYIKLLNRTLLDLGVFGAQIQPNDRSEFYHGDVDRMLIYSNKKFTQYPEIKQLNRVCGYVVLNVIKTGSVYVTTIEKVFPQDKPIDFESVKKFYNITLGDYGLYHVTPSNVVEKIKKIGLTPRSSQTTFRHSGSRIYLFFCYGIDNLESVKNLAKVLAYNRASMSIFGYIPHYSILKINPPKDIKFYFDPSLTKHEGFNGFGVFTSQNIPPQNITEIHRFNPDED